MLASAGDLSVQTGVPETDPKLQLALRRASDRFVGEVGHPVELVTDESVALSGEGGPDLLLPAAPVVGDVIVTIDGEPVEDVEVYRRAGVLHRATGWPVGVENVGVIYTHGHNPVPGDVSDAVLEQAEAIYRALPAVASLAAGAESISFSTTGVTQRWSDAVDRYQLNRGDRA